VGDTVEVLLESRENDTGMVVLSKEKADKMRIWDEISAACERDELVEGVIVGRVKGGLSVDIGVKAFLPGSQVDIRPVRNLDKLIGEKFKFKVIKFNKKRGNIVLSRRVLLERERDEMKAKTLETLTEGMTVKGTIKNITEYGAFVDLGGIDGLLHITDMSWGRINHPSEVINVGDDLRVVVLKFDRETERVSLGMKQLQADPWTTATIKYPVGARVKGKVVSLTDYGAFVELEQGVEGLIHVSEMSWSKKVKHPSKLLTVGQEVECQVLGLDQEAHRISLGLKQVESNPWEQLAEKYPIGSRLKGKVRNLTEFGAFVEVEEGIDGLVHISDLHWTKKIKHPSDVYKKGDEIEAVVLGIDVDNERISLGIKQLQEDPWNAMPQRYPVGSRVTGTVTSVTDFGVFVELEEGLEGLIHVSQLSTERVDKPSQLFSVGDKVDAEVTNVDPRERRIGLSIKALKRSEEREEVDSYLRRERESSKFSFEDILSEELRLDRDEGDRPAKAKGTLEK
jgi:small subunit ribosomal protein S1